VYVAMRFTEHGFTPTRERRWQRSATILRRGIALARGDREILAVFAATFLVNGANEAYGRLYPRRLVELGLPAQPDPIVWFTALGVVAFATGALALRIVELRIAGAGVARRTYAAACGIGVAGLLLLACAPNDAVAGAGVLVVSGVALTLTSAVGAIWVNSRTANDVRATVQSLLAQAEYLGEIVCGFALGALAQLASIPAAFVCACGLIACAGVVVMRARDQGVRSRNYLSGEPGD
jgi:predicted MFS family arabinose efflux permease